MQYGDDRYDVSFLSSNPLAHGDTWYAEPHFVAELADAQTTIHVTGTLRAREHLSPLGERVRGCWRCSRHGRPFDDLCCPACRAITQATDFRKRVTRRAQRDVAIASNDRSVADLRSTRGDLLPHGELLAKARRLREDLDSMQRRVEILFCFVLF